MKCRLKELREKNGYTQSKIAAILNVSQQIIQSAEGGEGEVPIELAVKAAEHFQVSVEYFLYLSEDLNGEFLSEYAKLNAADQNAVKKIIQNLKKVQDMYRK